MLELMVLSLMMFEAPEQLKWSVDSWAILPQVMTATSDTEHMS